MVIPNNQDYPPGPAVGCTLPRVSVARTHKVYLPGVATHVDDQACQA